MKTATLFTLIGLFSISSHPVHSQGFEWVQFNPDNRNQNIFLISKHIESLASKSKADIWFFNGIDPSWSDELANAVALGSGMEVGLMPQTVGKSNQWLMIYNHQLTQTIQAEKVVESIQKQWVERYRIVTLDSATYALAKTAGE